METPTAARSLWGQTLSAWVSLLLIGNVLDAVFTSSYLSLHVVEEVNPLMRWAWQGSPLSFFMAKLTMVPLGVMLLTLHSRSACARYALRVTAITYGLIVVWHLKIMSEVPVLLAQL
jgi:hypothetical protein